MLRARYLLFAFAGLYCIAVLRFAWVSDDAFIVARTLDNFFAGHGLGVNVGERVQSYTSPLWMLLCLPLYGLTVNPYLTLIVPGLLLSLALAFTLGLGFRERPWAGAGVLVALTASSTLLAFSTSGLENPLAHWLVALLYFSSWSGTATDSRAGLCVLLLLSGLLFLTRFDFALLVLPALAVAIWQHRGRVVRDSWLLLLPVAGWLTFSLVYYGFPFPNTAYAKLNTDIPRFSLVAQGFAYVVDAAYRDPALTFGSLLPLFAVRSRWLSTKSSLLLWGSACYVLYVIWIGGDFMSGRFFTVPYLIGLLACADALRGVTDTAWQKIVLACGLLVVHRFVDPRADRTATSCVFPPSGIVDERECYVEHTGLSQNVGAHKWRTHPYMNRYREALITGRNGVIYYDLIGLATFGDDRRPHIVERYGLSEPLLARIRHEPKGTWRPGHLRRDLPPGYHETLMTGTNQIVDPCVHALYDDLRLATRGPLTGSGRFDAIVRLNTTRRTCRQPSR